MGCRLSEIRTDATDNAEPEDSGQSAIGGPTARGQTWRADGGTIISQPTVRAGRLYSEPCSFYSSGLA